MRDFYNDRIEEGKFGEVSNIEATQQEFCRFVAIGIDHIGELQELINPDDPHGTIHKTVLPEVFVSFIFPRVLDREQHIFLSKDYSRLIDIRDEEASIYKLER